MKQNQRPQIYLIFFICLSAISCQNEKEPDLSKIKVNIPVERFDLELASLKPSDVAARVPQLEKKYGRFYADYMEGMLGLGPVSDTAYYQTLRSVLQNKDFKELTAEVNRVYPDMEESQEELTSAFKHLRYYFPKQKLPRIIAFVSGFAVQTPVGDGYTGIGLDMFLGRNSKFYPALIQSIPQYISRRFTPEAITPRVVEGFIREDMFPVRDADRSFLAKMVYQGKVLFLMDAFMPAMPDSLKLGYTSQQLVWADQYKPEVWAYFLENDLLYETDYMKIQKYLSDAPFTPGLGGADSAPKLGVYTGWQIVKQYMERNPSVTLPELLEETDAQKVLEGSKYKPR